MSVNGCDRWRGDAGSNGGRDRHGATAVVRATAAPPDAMQSDARSDGPRRAHRRSARETGTAGLEIDRFIAAAGQRLSRDEFAVCTRDDHGITRPQIGDQSALETVQPTVSMSERSFTATNCSRHGDYYDVAIKVTADLHNLFRRRRGISSAGNSSSSDYLSASE